MHDFTSYINMDSFVSPQRCVLKSVCTDDVSPLKHACVNPAGGDWTAPAVSTRYRSLFQSWNWPRHTVNEKLWANFIQFTSTYSHMSPHNPMLEVPHLWKSSFWPFDLLNTSIRHFLCITRHLLSKIMLIPAFSLLSTTESLRKVRSWAV